MKKRQHSFIASIGSGAFNEYLSLFIVSLPISLQVIEKLAVKNF